MMTPSTQNNMDRRTLLASAAKTFLGVSLLPVTGLAAAPAVPGKGKAKRVIYLYMAGGMSQLDTFDPKPENRTVQGPVEAIKTALPGVRFSEYVPRLAKQAKQLAVVRSLASTQGAHEQGNYYMHASYVMRGTIRHPGLGAWIQKLDGVHNDRLPANISIGGGSRGGGAGFLESRFAPLAIGNPKQGLQNSQRPKMVSSNLFDNRLELANAFDRKFHAKYNLKEVRAYKDMYTDAVKLMNSTDLDAFDINKESKKTQEDYGDNSFGQGCLLARRLIENDVRCVEVTSGGWDSHTNNFLTVEEKAAELDQALSALLHDLSSKGLLEETLVVVATEFGRTPEINSNDGRDHSPSGFSCLLAGGGIAGGQVYGATDENGKYATDDEVSVPDFNATIAHALNLPLDEVVLSPSGRLNGVYGGAQRQAGDGVVWINRQFTLHKKVEGETPFDPTTLSEHAQEDLCHRPSGNPPKRARKPVVTFHLAGYCAAITNRTTYLNSTALTAQRGYS